MNNQEKIWQILSTVTDPEVPVLTILDLGIVRDVKPLPASPEEGGELGYEIIITPTYTGCPAMDMISMDIKLKLLENGFKNFKITNVLSPAWTTDWMSEDGKRKLKEYGIAPPKGSERYQRSEPFADGENIECPKCNSTNTKLISQFGSTACKALYQCQDCMEPFDYFKCH